MSETYTIRDSLPYFILREKWEWPGYSNTLEMLVTLNSRLRYQRINDTMFLFHLNMDDVKIIFHLEVIRGSIMTFVWNKHARIDDEYILSMEINGEQELCHLWTVSGIDGLSGTVADWDVNWLNWRKLYEMPFITNNIGLITFVKFTSHLLSCLPCSIENNFLTTPMPLFLM